MWQVHCIHPCLMLNNALLRCCSIRGLHVTCRLYQHCALKCSPWPDACFVFLSIVAFRFQPARATTNRGDAVPGRPCPPALLEDEADALKDMKRCIEEFHDDKRFVIILSSCCRHVVIMLSSCCLCSLFTPADTGDIHTILLEMHNCWTAHATRLSQVLWKTLPAT